MADNNGDDMQGQPQLSRKEQRKLAKKEMALQKQQEPKDEWKEYEYKHKQQKEEEKARMREEMHAARAAQRGGKGKGKGVEEAVGELKIRKSKPRRANTAFQFFCETQSGKSREENLKAWKELSESDKLSFKELARKDSERFDTEQQEYLRTQQEHPELFGKGGGTKERRRR